MPSKAKAKAPAATERELVAMLRTRYEQDSGNGPQGAVLAGVRDAAGFDAKRTIDALAVSFWPSRGLTIDAFECKSSRSDFQREINAPEKADRFCELADRFWIVAGRDDVASADEMPPNWGLLVARGGKLVQAKPALMLRDWKGRGANPLPPGFDRGFLVSMIRQSHRMSKVEPEEIKAARAEGFASGTKSGQRSLDFEVQFMKPRIEALDEFEKGFGVRIAAWRDLLSPRRDPVSPEELGVIVRGVLQGEQDVTRIRNQMSAAADNAERVAQEARRQLDALDLALDRASASTASREPRNPGERT
jgi:hypothetical protein